MGRACVVHHKGAHGLTTTRANVQVDFLLFFTVRHVQSNWRTAKKLKVSQRILEKYLTTKISPRESFWRKTVVEVTEFVRWIDNEVTEPDPLFRVFSNLFKILDCTQRGWLWIKEIYGFIFERQQNAQKLQQNHGAPTMVNTSSEGIKWKPLAVVNLSRRGGEEGDDMVS